MSQVAPLYPNAQVQEKVDPEAAQVPPFKQGRERQGSVVAAKREREERTVKIGAKQVVILL